LQIASRLFDFSHSVYVMGILNVTPDSFSDGGRYLHPQQALDQALKMQEEGADIIDVGAESTRPGAVAISAEDEIKRLEPLFNLLVPRLKIPVSIDTQKAGVAEFAIQKGAALINDVSGFEFDPEMISVLQRHPVPAILMHSREAPPSPQPSPIEGEGVMENFLSFFEIKLVELEKKGISSTRLILDPGIGFAKQGKENVEILSQLHYMKKFSCPLMVGLSRKSFLEEYFGPTSHPSERGLGTEVAHALAISQGANLLRVHDVAAAKKTIRFVKEFKSPLAPLLQSGERTNNTPLL